MDPPELLPRDLSSLGIADQVEEVLGFLDILQSLLPD